jgi:hypothetical protein
LDSNICFSTQFSNTLSLCFSLIIREEVSHPYKTIGITTYLYFNLHVFGCHTGRQKIVHQRVAGILLSSLCSYFLRKWNFYLLELFWNENL